MRAVDQVCSHKRSYATPAEARAVAKAMRRRTNDRIVAYRCRYCTFWHLGNRARDHHCEDTTMLDDDRSMLE